LWDSPLLSEAGKRRAAHEIDLPRHTGTADQSLGHFLRRRFGDELVENLIEPLLSGIYAGDIDNMSLFATFPEFYHLEQQYGSVMRGLQHKQKSRQTGKEPGKFYTFKQGLDTFIKELQSQIRDDVIAYHSEVETISSSDGNYTIHLTSGEKRTADIVIMTTSHNVLPKVFSTHYYFQVFSDVPSTSVANVVLAFDQAMIDEDLDGTGFVVSRNHNSRITACTWTHKKWEHTTPAGKALLRAYVGRPSDQKVVHLSNQELTNIVLEDIRKTMSISGNPEFSVVTRWKEAMPQYTIGHKDRMEKVREHMAETLPGIFIAGSSYEGVGIPDCIGQAENAVQQCLHYLIDKGK